MVIEKKTVFITGASSGIGKACAELFAKNGARVIMCARRIDKLNEIAYDIIKNTDAELFTFQLDVCNRKAVDTIFDSIPDNWKNIDILINNAGLASGFERFHEGNVDDWEEMIDTNIKGLLYVTRKAVPLMIENGRGHIINIGSLAGVASYPNGAVYCATKAAVKFISDGLRMDLVDKPIKVTNIQPGMVDTNFSVVRFHGDTERAENVYKGIEPLKAEDIADIAYFAASVPARVQICEVTVTPTHQATGGIVFKKG